MLTLLSDSSLIVWSLVVWSGVRVITDVFFCSTAARSLNKVSGQSVRDLHALKLAGIQTWICFLIHVLFSNRRCWKLSRQGSFAPMEIRFTLEVSPNSALPTRSFMDYIWFRRSIYAEPCILTVGTCNSTRARGCRRWRTRPRNLTENLCASNL